MPRCTPRNAFLALNSGHMRRRLRHKAPIIRADLFDYDHRLGVAFRVKRRRLALRVGVAGRLDRVLHAVFRTIVQRSQQRRTLRRKKVFPSRPWELRRRDFG